MHVRNAGLHSPRVVVVELHRRYALLISKEDPPVLPQFPERSGIPSTLKHVRGLNASELGLRCRAHVAFVGRPLILDTRDLGRWVGAVEARLDPERSRI